MIPEKLKDLWPLIYTWLNGGRVQIKIISDWRDVQSISDFKNFNNEFRVYSEPKLVPFTFEDKDLFKDKWFRLKTTRGLFKASYIDESLITIGASQNSYSELMQLFEFEDGSPCGKYIE